MRDYTKNTAKLTHDVTKQLDEHPDSFDCLYYRADTETPEDMVSLLGVQDVVGSSESSSRKIAYAEPVQSRARIIYDEGMTFLAYESGHDEDYGSATEPVVILLRETNVPKQSVISWKEKSEDGTEKVVFFYILESRPYGRAPAAGMKHYCIPFLNDGELE